MSPDEMNQKIAQRMRERRKEKRLTQTALSKRSDVSLGSLKRFEQTGEISLSSLVNTMPKFDRKRAERIASEIQEIVWTELKDFVAAYL